MAATPLYLPVHLGFALTPGVHVLTTRVTYTVPVGKIARLTSGGMTMAEAAGIAIQTAFIILNINATQVLDVTNIGIAAYNNIPLGVIDLNSGDVILIQTVQSAAGAIAFSGMMQIREYQ